VFIKVRQEKNSAQFLPLKWIPHLSRMTGQVRAEPKPVKNGAKNPIAVGRAVYFLLSLLGKGVEKVQRWKYGVIRSNSVSPEYSIFLY